MSHISVTDLEYLKTTSEIQFLGSRGSQYVNFIPHKKWTNLLGQGSRSLRHTLATHQSRDIPLDIRVYTSVMLWNALH